MDVLDNEFLLQDRLQKIQQIIPRYGENNFFISYSGGKDSTVLHELIDMALPGNNIPRVYANTGIELNMIRDFVVKKSINDNRFIIIQPSTPIKQMLERDGYPFKSKAHSHLVERYQKTGLKFKSVRVYLQLEKTLKGQDVYRPCPQILKYQFTNNNLLKISDKCCLRLKEEPVQNWCKVNNKKYGIVGVMREEGGRRFNARCLRFENGKLLNFQPLAPMSKDWEEWFIQKYNIEICDIYKPPYNFDRTGCKGCPFNPNIKHELDVLQKFFPNERKQCELIWAPVYDEYRRIGYRLKGDI